jgi:hypothetical protein
VTVTPAEHDRIQRAAAWEDLAMADIVRRLALRWADVILTTRR